MNDERRDETEDERLDRKFQDMLQELRVMQTGAQLTAGFLLTLPFQEPFKELDEFQRTVYLALVVGAGLTTALLLSPVAIHRKLTGAQVKERVLKSTHRLMAAALTTLATIIVGIIFFTFDVVIDRSMAFVAAGAMAVVVASLMLALPYSLARGKSSEPD